MPLTVNLNSSAIRGVSLQSLSIQRSWSKSSSGESAENFSASAKPVLDDAARFTRTSESAISNIERLLAESSAIAKTFESKALSATQSAALEEEAEALLGEISRISDEATFNDEPLSNFEGSTIIASIGASSPLSSDGKFVASLPTTALSLEDLGLDSLTGESFSSDSSATLATIEAAENSIDIQSTDVAIRSTNLTELQTIAEEEDAVQSGRDTNSSIDMILESYKQSLSASLEPSPEKTALNQLQESSESVGQSTTQNYSSISTFA